MINSLVRSRRLSRGFTLIELLVVIAIIAILAGLILPAIGKAKLAAQKAQAKNEMQGLTAAISQYDTAYSRLPISDGAKGAGTAANPDFTFGTVTTTGAVLPAGKPGTTLPTINNNNGTGYQAPNSDVMAILMDITNFPGTLTPTSNPNHAKNPQQTSFINLKMVSTTNSPGVGPDLIFRDPWSNPYIITLDANYDNRVQDSFYGKSKVSSQTGSLGINGLANQIDSSGASDQFTTAGQVMIWSLGPDGSADPTKNANTVPNKDNILSW